MVVVRRRRVGVFQSARALDVEEKTVIIRTHSLEPRCWWERRYSSQRKPSNRCVHICYLGVPDDDGERSRTETLQTFSQAIDLEGASNEIGVTW